ncbi:MAG: hypothetical protein IJN46_07505 [Lachnospiraceae bacterium]|nr:hypothetical protein [Lachnospiraceae bacterium]
MEKKMKKLLALVLTFCMIMSQASMVTFATENEGEGSTTEKVMVNGDKTATELDENFNSDVTLTIP